MAQEREKNPYPLATPEWLLYENLVSNENTANAFFADSQRYLEKASAARENAEQYRKALKKLTSNP